MNCKRLREVMFTYADFAVLGVLIVVPSFIGIYFGYSDRKNSSASKYFFGEKKMNPISVGISTAVTSISAITMIAYPAEVYLVGTVFFWSPLAAVTAGFITFAYYVPFYSKLQLDTVYGYLELRFNRMARRLVAVVVPISEIFYMATMIYIPSLALSAVAPISIDLSIGLIGFICTFYTTLGGMKAVVWTDVVQSVFMLFGAVMLLIQGLIVVGGFEGLQAALERGNRTTFWKFDDFDISSRMHPLAVAVGDFFMFTKYLGFAQPIYQRILSCRSTRQSQYSIIAYVIPAVTIISISVANGLIMYAYFEGCDPVKSGLLESLDQGAPYMALKEFSHLPGMAGLFVGAVFCGTLSSISSGLNAYANVIVEDFIMVFFPKISEKMKLLVGKVSGVFLGLLVVTFSFAISRMGQNTYMIMRSLAGAVGGPVLGIFLLGIFLPWTNSLGAIVGAGITYVIMIWLFIGSIFLLYAPPRVDFPPRVIEHCSALNETLNTSIATSAEFQTAATFATGEQGPTEGNFAVETEYTFDQTLYSLNFHYYILFGGILTILIGLVVSFISGSNRPSNMDPKLFMPIIDNPNLPKQITKFFRFGVPTELEAEQTKKEAQEKTLLNGAETCMIVDAKVDMGTELKELGRQLV